jgi:hypothetical protein
MVQWSQLIFITTPLFIMIPFIYYWIFRVILLLLVEIMWHSLILLMDLRISMHRYLWGQSLGYFDVLREHSRQIKRFFKREEKWLRRVIVYTRKMDFKNRADWMRLCTLIFFCQSVLQSHYSSDSDVGIWGRRVHFRSG